LPQLANCDAAIAFPPNLAISSAAFFLAASSAAFFAAAAFASAAIAAADAAFCAGVFVN